MLQSRVTMSTMKAKYVLPLLALSVADAAAGEREAFDFGWKFKYFGPGDPAEAGVPVMTDSHQGTHAAAHAVDGGSHCSMYRRLCDCRAYEELDSSFTNQFGDFGCNSGSNSYNQFKRRY